MCTGLISTRAQQYWLSFFPERMLARADEEKIYSDDLTMKFWRLTGFITTGGPAVRGHAWNFLSVSFPHSSVAMVRVVVPSFAKKHMCKQAVVRC